MSCDFSYQHYREILKKALGAGFMITNFRDIAKVKPGKTILLRHDIDYMPQRALEIAKIEKKLNIKSTYFIRVHGEYYHPFDRIAYPAISKIIALGHEIGLHTEARDLSKKFNLKMIDLFKKEKEMLAKIFNISIKTAAEHADIGRSKQFWQIHFFKMVQKDKVGIKRFPQEFNDFHYLSDSLGRWREGCLCKNILKYDKIQVLIHPDHWGGGARKNVKKLIKNNPLVKNANLQDPRYR